MLKKVFLYSLSIFFCISSMAQSREELERQRNELKKELEETENLLKKHKKESNENLLQWRLINQKVNLQDKLVSNINKDLRAINDELYLTQLEINRYDRLLDTLREDYAKSMVYAYKNRSNYDFLNFIFSADNFNDAVKRIAYLKSYRDYREMQGQNIIRTQLYRQKKVEQLAKTKRDKNTTLTAKSDELKKLEQEEQEKDRVVAELKKKSNQLTKQVAQKKAQMRKVENIIAAAIKKAREDARKAALAKEAAEKKKRDEEAKALAAKLAEEKRQAEATAANNNKPDAKTPPATATPKPATPTEVAAVKPTSKSSKPMSDLLTADNIALNASFENNKGRLPWPLDKGYTMMHFGNNKLPSGSDYVTNCVTIACDVGASVKSIFEGEVITVTRVDDFFVIIVQHGKYIATYSNLATAKVSVGNKVHTGQVLGTTAPNMDGIGVLDFYLSDDARDINPEIWLGKLKS